MKIPLSWLKEYLPNTLTTTELAELLTQLGLEVESVEEVPLAFTDVVVGKVLETQPHPNAHSLQVAMVSDGTDTYQVVCAASNCRPGLNTAFAKLGAKLIEGDKSIKIRKSKIRDVPSDGMLCSGKELGLTEESDGIMELPERYIEGTPLSDIFGDTLLDIGLTPNLGHCNSVLGVVRELSAGTGLPFEIPSISLQEAEKPIEDFATVSIESFDACPRYSCRVVYDLRVKSSPEWLKRRLAGCGIRSINNVVDATNLIMMELGQPLHAFDYDLLEGGKIVVRMAKAGEKFQTLDEVERTLNKDSLLICDGEKPVALAGVMGGHNSEVSYNTATVLIESAHFNPKAIRRSSRGIDLMTDASRRFERGCDPNIVLEALDRAAALIAELGNGKVAAGTLDIKRGEFLSHIVSCRLSRINAILGTHLAISEVEDVLRKLSFPYRWDNEDLFHISIPTYRFDIKEEIDIIEEVARIYGFHNLPKVKPRFNPSSLSHSASYLFEKEVRHQLISLGLQEFLTCDLIGPTELALTDENSVPRNSVVKVLKPTSIDQSLLRPSLLPGLLTLTKFNHDQQTREICGFEVGKIHFKIQVDDQEHYQEQSVAGLVLTGSPTPPHWSQPPREADFYDIKGIVENFLNVFGVEKPLFEKENRSEFHPGRQARLMADDLVLGIVGEIHPNLLKKLDYPKRIYYAEIFLQELFKIRKGITRMKELPSYPGSERDWTLTVDADVPVQNILKAMRSIPSMLLKRIRLVSIYQSDKLGLDKKNITFNILYRHDKKTLDQEAVEREHARIVEGVLSQLGDKVAR